jgi:iron complex transport system substrate-binding protein
LLLGACGGAGAPSRPEPEGAPGRVVALAPNLTEIVFALGLGDRVVGVSDYTSWPPEARQLPRLGGLVDPNLERLLALDPDLTLLLPSQEEVAVLLAGLGIATLTVEIETVDDLERAVAAVAEGLGDPEAGWELAAALRRELAPRPVAGAPATAVVLNRIPGRAEGVLVAGPNTYFDDLLGRLGAANAFADAPLRYPQVGTEEILARAPGAILELRAEPPSEALRSRLVADWRRFPGLPAAARGQVHVFGGDWALALGPRLPMLYRRMEAALRAAAEVV